MKNLNSYKKIAKELIKEAAWDRKFGEPLPTLEDVMKESEVGDDKIIKYKDKEGESQEMKAGSAKTMEKDHPAKIAWDKMQNDGGDDKKDSGGKLGGSDFDRDANRADDDREEDPNVKGEDEPKGKLTQKGEKIQKSKEEFDDIIDDGAEPDVIGMWIDDNRYSLSGDGNPTKTMRAFRNLEDAYRDAQEEDDWDAYEEQLEDIKNSISKRLDTMIDLNTEKPESDKPKGDKPKEKPQQTAADSREARNRVIKRIGRQAFDKLSYGEMEAEYEKELKAMGKRESIKVIDGKKYKAIKESKKNPRILKEIYDRTFRSLK